MTHPEHKPAAAAAPTPGQPVRSEGLLAAAPDGAPLKDAIGSAVPPSPSPSR